VEVPPDIDGFRKLAHRWYLGYALDEDFPDDASLTRIRQRLGMRFFERCFEKIVDLRQETALNVPAPLSVWADLCCPS
jgi:hypothetical protein